MNLQEGQGGKAKAYQVEQLLKAIDRLKAEQAAKKDVKTAPEKKQAKVKKR